jgi:hypothetical protein
MRFLKAGLVQLLLLGALGSASAAPALAELPDVHVLSGEIYPVRAEGRLEGPAAAALESEVGEKLTATKVVITAELLELSSLGPGLLEFFGVLETKSKTSCNSPAMLAGIVRIADEYHVVDTSEFPTLTAAVLVLFKEATIECNSGKLKIKVRSPLIIKLEKVTSGTDVTEYGLVAKCSGKGKQELKEYLNEAGKSTKGALTANFGLGFEAACGSIEHELLVTSSKMLDFLF